MEFGIAVATSTDSWKVVKRAEELGFTDAWFYDTQLLNPDIFIGMALAAEHTSKIGLGTGVLIPANRIAPVAANALASNSPCKSLRAMKTQSMPGLTCSLLCDFVRLYPESIFCA